MIPLATTNDASLDRGTAAPPPKASSPTTKYRKRFTRPATALGLAVLAGPLELAIPPVIVGGAIAVAAWPTWKRTLQRVERQRELDAEVLDSLWILFHTLTGELFAPALALCLTEVGHTLRDMTADAGRRKRPNPVPSRHYWIERKGRRRRVLTKHLMPGDQVLLGPGDRVPADGTVVLGEALLDQHAFGGSAKLRTLGFGDEVYASTVLVEGQITLNVQRTGADTRAAGLLAAVHEKSRKQTRISNYVSEISDRAVLPALGVSLALYAATGNPTQAIAPLQLDFALGIAISAPVPVLACLQHAAANGVLIRSGHALERLATIDAIVFDKTGTLTETGVKVSGFDTVDSAVSEDELIRLAASVCYYVLRPFSTALADVAEQRAISRTAVEARDYSELGAIGEVNGHSVAIGTYHYLQEHGITIDADYHRRHDGVILNRSQRYVVRDGVLLGTVFYSNAIRKEAATAIETLGRLGIACYLVSGDSRKATTAVGYQLGFRPERTFAEADGERKLAVLQKLRERHRTIAFVGDGINDAAAMSQADVSAAPQSATDLARETADVVLLDDDLRGLSFAILTARRGMSLVRQNITTVTAANVAIVIGGALLDLSPVVATAVNNGSTLLAALNGLRPLRDGPRQDPAIERTVLRSESGLLGIPWRKRARGEISALLNGPAEAAG